MSPSHKTIKGSDLARAVVSSLTEYTDDVVEGIRKEINETGKETRRAIRDASMVGKTGDYKAGWKVTKRDTKGTTVRIVHNADVPGLPHLLEHGHASRFGGRVAGKPHIKPASDPLLERLESRVRAIIRKGG